MKEEFEQINMLEILMVGGRLNKQFSSARPMREYFDPSNAVRLSTIRRGKCDNCINQAVSAEGQHCIRGLAISSEIMHCEFYKGAKK